MEDVDFYGKIILGTLLIVCVGLWLVDWSWRKVLIGVVSSVLLGIVLTLGVGLPLIEGTKLGDVYDILLLHFVFTLSALQAYEKVYERELIRRAQSYDQMGWLKSPAWRKGQD